MYVIKYKIKVFFEKFFIMKRTNFYSKTYSNNYMNNLNHYGRIEFCLCVLFCSFRILMKNFVFLTNKN